MNLGINLMAWSGAIGEEELDLLAGIAGLGYSGVELPILAPDAVDAESIRRACQEAGLSCTASSALPPGASLLDPRHMSEGIAFLERAAAVAAKCGATILCGPLYAPVGEHERRSRSAEEWDSCIIGLREAGQRAAEHGLTLAIEPLNRFETNFLNTVDDALALLDAVDHPAVGLHLDTFHMNIEEKDIPSAIRRSSRHLRHVHFSENDRGVVGSGHVEWDGVHEALRDIGYADWVVAETFAGAIPEIAAATAIWRPLVPDPWTYARESLAFMSRLLQR